MSEFKCEEGKLYLLPIKDLFNGKIIAYDLTRTPNFEQITRMIAQAVVRLEEAKPILHSEGWLYQMSDFREICQKTA